MDLNQSVFPTESMDKLDQLDSLNVKDHSENPEDPFGDESQTGMKYKTMTWW
jgi:hypothetical protein